VTESGILSPADVTRMREAGVNAFSRGEAFMRSPDPGAALVACSPPSGLLRAQQKLWNLQRTRGNSPLRHAFLGPVTVHSHTASDFFVQELAGASRRSPGLNQRGVVHAQETSNDGSGRSPGAPCIALAQSSVEVYGTINMAFRQVQVHGGHGGQHASVSKWDLAQARRTTVCAQENIGAV